MAARRSWQSRERASSTDCSRRLQSLIQRSALVARDNGNSEFPSIGKVPFCAQCQQRFYERPYPQWLKLGLAFLLMLLVVALVHGRKYFHAGREMYVGEKLVSQGRYAEAVPHLEQTVQVAPNSDKAVLLMAKAFLLSGNPKPVDTVLRGHNGGKFEDSAEFQEVDRIYDRATNAIQETSQAVKLAGQSGKEEEAARLMHHAAATYPEMPGLDELAQGASPEAMKLYEEYAMRIRYRLDSREIIDKPEYDRRFRAGERQAKN